MDHIYMQRMRADLADKVANGPVAQPQLVKVNQKPQKSQTKTKSTFSPKQSHLAGANLTKGSLDSGSERESRLGMMEGD
jgi:hypothetical protein